MRAGSTDLELLTVGVDEVLAISRTVSTFCIRDARGPELFAALTAARVRKLRAGRVRRLAPRTQAPLGRRPGHRALLLVQGDEAARARGEQPGLGAGSTTPVWMAPSSRRRSPPFAARNGRCWRWWASTGRPSSARSTPSTSWSLCGGASPASGCTWTQPGVGICPRSSSTGTGTCSPARRCGRTSATSPPSGSTRPPRRWRRSTR